MANEDKLRDYLKRVMADLHDTRRRLSEAQSQELEPVAIVAMSCRLPGGVRNPDDLWELLREGRDAVAPFPDDRGWDLERLYHPDPDHPGTSYAREGGFVDGAGDFDSAFFGISPREALTMDPQQRLLLETSWEAVEAAGIDPASLRGSRTGVFVGTNGQDYGTLLMMSPDGDEGHSMTGGAAAVASGRVSYALGLEGPAVSIDTACSSSLVALHLAVQALRARECDLALAGGVTVMATPGLYIGSSRQRALSTDGRCRSFAAAADGAGFSEGVGWLLVERLSDARRNGHRVLAVVRGTAVNQDGASNGLTAPNGPAQQRVISQALTSARLSTADVDVVEAHGTGTKLGDPIEAQALIATYGQDRGEAPPLLLGSVKSNIGHAQAAAGVAGVIKLVLAIRHGLVPATLHVDAPSPHVDWAAGAVELATEARPWPETGRVRRGAVSSFGISGTNAHVIIEQPTEPVEPGVVESVSGSGLVASDVVVWPVSARSRAALAGQVVRLAGHVRERGEVDPVAVGWSLATTRSAFDHRVVVVGSSAEGLLAGLDAFAAGEPAGNVVAGAASGPGAGPVFVFPGQGAQSVRMAAGLVGRVPVFDECLAECRRALAPYLDVDLVSVLTGEDESWLERVEVVQPVLWAVGVALAAVWRAAGVVPEVVIGHSQGEIGAACVAGILSLEDAARTVALRSRALAVLRGTGTMASVDLPVDAVAERLPAFAGVGVAAVNGPSTVVVSGPPERVAGLVQACRAEGVRARLIPVDYASHSPAVQEVAEQLRADLAGVSPRAGHTRLVSTLTGDWVDPAVMTADYWYDNLRQTVLFDAAVRTAVAAGYTTFVEISPHPVLAMPVTAILDDAGVSGHTIGSLRRGDDDVTRLLTNLATAYTVGLPVDLTKVLPAAATVDLPTYAFDHHRYWPAPPLFLAAADAAPDIDRWRYRVTWRALPDLPLTWLAGTWLVPVPAALEDDPLVTDVLSALGNFGADVVPVELDATGDPAALAERLSAALAGPGGPVAVLSLLGLDERAHPEHPATSLAVSGTALLVQALGLLGVEAPLWCATRGAVVACADDPAPRPAAASVWGLGRAVALEHPARWGGLLDLPDVLDAQAGALLCAALGASGGEDAFGDDGAEQSGRGEDQLAVRASGVFVRRLTRITEPETAASGDADDTWRMRGTVLITGGTGGLGGHLARWAGRSGAAHVLLASRRGPDAPGAAELEAELTDLGVRVTVARCDVADRAQVADLLAAVPADAPLSAVLHTAAVLDDSVINSLTLEQVDYALSAKVTTALNLHELTRELDLDAFILFSSMAGTVGSSGVGNYAPGNAFLNALAEHRRALGLPATSIGWGAWGGGGMADGEFGRMLHRHGAPEMPPRLAVAALHQAVEHDETFLTISNIAWDRFFVAFTATRPGPLISEIPEAQRLQATKGLAETKETDEAGSAGAFTRMSAAERQQALLDLVRDQAAAVLKYADGQAVDPHHAFRDLGFDSVTAVELRNRLATATSLRLPVTLVFDYPSPTALARHLHEELGGEAAVAVEAAPVTLGDDEPVAIVAMSCRFPGGANDPERFWQMLHAGLDAVSDLPGDRGWDVEKLYDPDPYSTGTSYVRSGAFLYEAAEFDAGFFGISPREALAMDPQQRLLLEVSWEAVERAGVEPGVLRGSRTGVFVGTNGQDYGALLMVAGDEVEGFAGTGNAASVVSGRVAYALGLEGPAVSVDTACSSSLVALHLAVQSLRRGECDLALAGGVTVMATPGLFVEFSRQRGLAADGRCKAFAAGADGTGWGEGVGVLVVERLSDARRNGHEVLAIVRGSAVNQDGASNGLTAPNGPSQQRVIRQALASARLTTADVDVVEAHGTGTTLGDPIEAQALLATYGQERDEPLLLGSVKSNIGHTQAAAGVAGVIKMVLAMREGVVPATLHVDEPSPHIDWNSGAVELAIESRPWPAVGRARRSAVSSFGISGTNAHVIIELPEDLPAESVEPDGEAAEDRSPGLVASDVVVWTVSGRSKGALAGQAARLAQHVRAHADLDAAALGWSLAATRSTFDQRAAVVGATVAELLAGLDALSAGAPAGNLVTGTASGTGAVFVFPGQGAQSARMAAGLVGRTPVFDARLAECQRALAPYLDVDLVSVLTGDDESWLERVEVVQPVLWAVGVALAAVWQHAGVTPAAVVGHSQGEIGAACVAGILSLEDAAKAVALRSRALTVLRGTGTMASVDLSAEAVAERLGEFPGVGVAAVNGPSTVVVSGPPQPVADLVEACQADGVRARLIPVDYASHSVAVQDVAEQLRADLADVTPRQGNVRLVSTLTGDWVDPASMTADYWYDNLRQTVQFEAAVRVAVEAGHTTFVEISPHPVLAMPVTAILDDAGATGHVLGSLRRGDDDATRLLTNLATAHTIGLPVDLTAVLAETGTVALPTYAFDRSRFWPTAATRQDDTEETSSGVDSAFWAAVESEDLAALAELTEQDATESLERLGAALPVLASWRRQQRNRSALDDLRYRSVWQPYTGTPVSFLPGAWWVIADARHPEEGEAAVAELSRRGADVRLVSLPENLTDRAALTAHLNGVTRTSDGGPAPVDGVLSLLALADGAVDDTQPVPPFLARSLALIQALGDLDVAAPLWCVTRGAAGTTRGAAPGRPEQSL
ncbi:SDR family NAD(P)-dependent oxidoreductase, partial [Micromonospora aurantiaca]|uniref:type I polyketide synthase n=1 Tax=Micromonospora aurantiaca (nom. illeg.) TaxID=47850 RepID=UPI0037FC8DC7